jgi:hypothetical protein
LILVNLNTFSASSHSYWFDEECTEPPKIKTRLAVKWYRGIRLEGQI